MMKNMILMAVVLGVAVAVFFGLRHAPPLTVLSAELHVVEGGPAMLFFRVDNTGGFDRLIGAQVEGQRAVFMPPVDSAPVPGGGTVLLAADGVHAMVPAPPSGLVPGDLVAITAIFAEGGPVTARAMVKPMGRAGHGDHGGQIEAAASKPPQVTLSLRGAGDGHEVRLNTLNFSFSNPDAPASHQPGEGHAHLYLDGVKLQRMYGPTARIGSLGQGTYQVRVVLNSNDHRAYGVAGQPVEALGQITVP